MNSQTGSQRGASAGSSLNADVIKPMIYLWYHRNAPEIKNAHLQPIQVGRALAKIELPYPGDNTGASISAKNRTYAEMTGIYWSWKNDKTSTHIGSFHYRRLLALHEVPYPANEHDTVSLPFFLPENLGHYGLDEASIRSMCEQYDVIMPTPTDVRAELCSSIEAQYAKHHTGQWFGRMISIAQDLFPQYSPNIKAYMRETKSYFFNMFLLRRDVFDDACAFVFSILEKLEQEVDVTTLEPKDQRLFGFMAERVFSLYFHILQATRKDLRYLHVRCLNVPEDKMLRQEARAIPAHVAANSVVPVVFASDAGYGAQLGVTITSLLKRSSSARFYDLIVLDSGLSAEQRSDIQQVVSGYSHASVRFIKLPQFKLANAALYRSQWSFATYNRLLLAEVLDYDAVVYLDCDLVVLDDVAKMYDEAVKGKLAGNLLAGVPDFFVTGSYRQQERFDICGKQETLQEYYSRLCGTKLGADETFFQAGSLVFNLKKIREEHRTREFLACFYDQNPQFGVDQDILNVVCKGQIARLDFRWNVVNHSDEYIQRITTALTEREFAELNASRQTPSCLHFTGAWLAKPFDSFADQIPFGRKFWAEARGTVWYEELLSRAMGRDLARLNGALQSTSYHFSQTLNQVGELSLRRTVKRRLGQMMRGTNNMFPKEMRCKIKAAVPTLHRWYMRIAY